MSAADEADCCRSAANLSLSVKVLQSLDDEPELLDVSIAQEELECEGYMNATGLSKRRDFRNPYEELLRQINGMREDMHVRSQTDSAASNTESSREDNEEEEEDLDAKEAGHSERQISSDSISSISSSTDDDVAESSPIVLEPNAAPARESSSQDFEVQIIHDISQVEGWEWDRIAVSSQGLNPFVMHGFLAALESSSSAGRGTGWTPHHLIVRSPGSNELVGCCPIYLKTHSQGEYIFDYSWANVAARLGVGYYPKLQCCVPFSPVGGPRFMAKPGSGNQAINAAMARVIKKVTDEFGISGLHVTFNNKAEWGDLSELGFLQRTGIQYHWDNPGYSSFEDFLSTLKSAKRKNIKQERRFVENSGLNVRRLSGLDLKPSHWDSFYQFYLNTCNDKWGRPYLTRSFFHQLGDSLPQNVLLVVAQEGDQASPLVAAALNMVGSEAIYGRNWGCAYTCNVKHLHFELCYYQAQEEAIARGLKKVEAGAQGEHKIQRGYLPSKTYSSHYIRDELLRSIIERHLDSEREQIDYTLARLSHAASPYKANPVDCDLRQQIIIPAVT